MQFSGIKNSNPSYIKFETVYLELCFKNFGITTWDKNQSERLQRQHKINEIIFYCIHNKIYSTEKLMIRLENILKKDKTFYYYLLDFFRVFFNMQKNYKIYIFQLQCQIRLGLNIFFLGKLTGIGKNGELIIFTHEIMPNKMQLQFEMLQWLYFKNFQYNPSKMIIFSLISLSFYESKCSVNNLYFQESFLIPYLNFKK